MAIETKAKCDDTNAMNAFKSSFVNDGNIKETFGNTNYSCCSSSCCNHKSSISTTKETTITTTAVKTTENAEDDVKSSDSSGITIKLLNIFLIYIKTGKMCINFKFYVLTETPHFLSF